MLNVMTLFKTSIIGLCICLAGAAMNYSVMFANGGKMPVFTDLCAGYEDVIIDSRHVCASAVTHLVPLADYIRLGSYIYSPGDFVLFTGQVLCVGAAVIFLGTRLNHIFKKK